MKTKSATIGIICLFLSLSLFFCQKENKIEFKTIDGVQVVFNPKNPVPPKGTPTKLTLEEDLSIGEVEGKEEYMFSRIWYVAVDNEENIYVMDQGETHIKVFDKNGIYLRTIGKKGDGPGELQYPNEIFITNRNQLVVEDFIRSLNIYSLDGKFIKYLSTAKLFPVGILVDSRGYILALTNINEPGKRGKEIRLFDPNLNYLKTLFTIPEPDPQIYNPFRAHLHWTLAKDDHVIIGYSEDYELQIFNSEGKLIKKIKKEHIPVKITQEDIEEWKKRTKRIPPGRKLIVPEHHPAFQFLSADDEGRIFVQTYEKTKDGDGYYYDVFDSEGKYIAKIPLKVRPRVLKKKKLYTIEEDENGFHVVKRYKVIWQ